MIPNETHAGNCYTRQNYSYSYYPTIQKIVVPYAQQYVAVPVQPYAYSWGGAQQTQAQTARLQADQYLTKKEFLSAMKDIVGELRASQTGQPSQSADTVDRGPVGQIIMAKCASCHTAPNGKHPPGQQPVNLVVDGKVNWDGISQSQAWNWDRLSVVTLTGKMPKGDTLTEQETAAFATFALNVPWQPQPTSKVPTNGPTGPPPEPIPTPENGNGGFQDYN
jgi:hypothetical protein